MSEINQIVSYITKSVLETVDAKIKTLETRLTALELNAETSKTCISCEEQKTFQEANAPSIQTTTTDETLVSESLQKLTFYPRNLLTPTEFKFFQTLKRVCADRYFLLTKVGLWALINSKADYSAWGKISQKHLDFVLCDPRVMEPVLVIELDDWTHNSPKRKVKDAEKDFILKKACIPILRILPQEEYNEDDLNAVIKKAMGID